MLRFMTSRRITPAVALRASASRAWTWNTRAASGGKKSHKPANKPHGGRHGDASGAARTPPLFQHAGARERWQRNMTFAGWWALAVTGGFTTYVLGVEAAVRAMGYGKEYTAGENVAESDRRLSYDEGANRYESEVCGSEAWIGMKYLRRRLLKHAQGRVLEIAAGTGANFGLYPDACTITATDCSMAMLDVAKGKNVSSRLEGVAVMEAEKLKFRDGEFDTVVDTFGLCSYEDPVAALKETQRVCKKGGRILLLEHGRSHWHALNALLDSSAQKHAQKWGCWWNRDINKIVEASGLSIVYSRRHHLGTTYFIVAQPGKARDGE